jgi:dinuclear metal center YbgI/SA1388 family protein
MATVQQVYELLARLAPTELAESWDNVGVLVDCGGAVDTILVTLDITPEVVAEAATRGAQLIVAHHPVIFSPLKTLGTRDVPYLLARAGISAVCMHTNLDAAEGGVNDVLAGLFGMRDAQPFAGGCGRVGTIDPIPVPALAARCKSVLGAHIVAPTQGEAVQVKYADTGREVRRLAVISGSGGSLFEDALAQGADCLLTGEASHHHACDAKRLGLSLIAAGHYATEFPVVARVAERLAAGLPGVRVLPTQEGRDPFVYV